MEPFGINAIQHSANHPISSLGTSGTQALALARMLLELATLQGRQARQCGAGQSGHLGWPGHPWLKKLPSHLCSRIEAQLLGAPREPREPLANSGYNCWQSLIPWAAPRAWSLGTAHPIIDLPWHIFPG